jgi:hypothetical protein
LSSLINVCGDKLTISPAGKASSGTLKDEVDGELLKKLSHPQLIALYEKFISWNPSLSSPPTTFLLLRIICPS